jgi:hypothetical protein
VYPWGKEITMFWPFWEGEMRGIFWPDNILTTALFLSLSFLVCAAKKFIGLANI